MIVGVVINHKPSEPKNVVKQTLRSYKSDFANTVPYVREPQFLKVCASGYLPYRFTLKFPTCRN